MRRLLITTILCLAIQVEGTAKTFMQFLDSFNTGYIALHIPELTFDYHAYFNNIPSKEKLEEQKEFFRNEKKELLAFSKDELDSAQQLYYDHVMYELDFNLQRVKLEMQWVKGGSIMPKNGLYGLLNRQEWYQYFIKKYTSSGFTPEQVYQFGLSETKRVQGRMTAIQKALGYNDATSFYKHLQNDSFFLSNKEDIIKAYSEIDKKVRSTLYNIIDISKVPRVEVIEWPDAGPNTPPGMYRSKEDNPYGADVFQYNFYGHRHNKRAMEWLYMHEAIPGHHLQSSFRRKLKNVPEFQKLFYYPGNFEGWGCYVEYLGKTLDLYDDPYKELGKWEWDLVRSARLALDAGIHYYGWNHARAVQFWKETIRGQDDIMEREISRVTNWPAQAISYKVGAYEIEMMKKDAIEHDPNFDLRAFHKQYLQMSYYPLEIVKAHLHNDLTRANK